jgi:anion-transporting  ArsA/GET3 family ATPase
VPLADLTDRKRILVCVGPGGVGKTTTAAALGLRAACAGRRTLVLTIDPARRLADSLGVGPLGHDPRPVPERRIREAGLAPHAPLEAMMLDPRRTFDDMVRRFAPDAEARARLLHNPIYQQIAGRLAGTQEYAAIAELHRLSRDGRWDLIVLDTPPSENALDFLSAPGRLADALDSPALQWFIRPTLSAGEFSLKMLGMGGSFVLRRMARLTGGAFLEDVAHFLVEFNAMLGGFRRRADEVAALLCDPALAFVVVTSPDSAAIDQALGLLGRLAEAAMPVGGVVVNRVHRAGPGAPADIGARLAATPRIEGWPPGEVAEAEKALRESYEEIQALALADAQQVRRLHDRAGERMLTSVPMLDADVHDLEGLALVARHLTGD